MADFSKPATTDTYANVLTYLKATTSDLALGLDPANTTPTNVPTNAIRWTSASNKWQKWNGTAWVDLSSLYAINISGNAASATNLAAGAAGAVPYQTGAGATAFSGVGTAGQAMLSGGTGVPTWGTLGIAAGGTGAITAIAALIALGERSGANGSVLVPPGTTAQRDASPTPGYFRFNSDLGKFEGYNGTAWGAVGGGATGGGSDAVFVQNGMTVTTNYTIPSGQSASSVGPITIQSGKTVTVSTGSRWVIL